MNRVSRRTMIVATGLVALLGTGCMTKPMQPANPDGTYCFATGKWYRRKLTCTPTPIPPESVEAEAKRFEPAPGLLTVYVVRKRWGDAVNQVRLTVDGGAPVVTTPESFVRLRMRPGPHTFAATWSEGATELAVTGAAGDVRVVELVGSVWAWGSTYRLDHGNLAEGRTRAARLRLVADVQ
jgi:hypothetical protein